MPALEFQICAVLTAVVAATTDMKTGRIPNWLTLPVVALALLAHVIAQGTWGAIESAAGLMLCAGVPWLAFRVSGGKAIGGGDVKLFGALGAIVGPMTGLEMELGSLGLLLAGAIVKMAFQGQLGALLRSTLRLLLAPVLKRARETAPLALTEMRLGPAVALSVLASVVTQQLTAGAW
jgi:prepilin peptidase CpaA